MRLDKYLSDCGVGTRSEVKNYIKKGRVKVDGIIVKDSGLSIDENKSEVTFDGNVLGYEKYHYIMLNKPEGFVCSANEKGERSILSLIHESFASKLFPVGRLDKDTTGLLLLTDDGPLCHRLLSPKKHVDKEYEVESRMPVTDEMVDLFSKGVDIGDDDLTLPAKLVASDNPLRSNIILHEGRFHQIKRMFEACDNYVVHLNRIRMKNLILDNELQVGEYRALTEEELNDLLG